MTPPALELLEGLFWFRKIFAGDITFGGSVAFTQFLIFGVLKIGHLFSRNINLLLLLCVELHIIYYNIGNRNGNNVNSEVEMEILAKIIIVYKSLQYKKQRFV